MHCFYILFLRYTHTNVHTHVHDLTLLEAAKDDVLENISSWPLPTSSGER